MKINYSHLQEEYPAIITLEQLYQICHISKRKGRWLLENGVIPCQDSGKRTRRFRIRLKDVITYLENTRSSVLKVTVPSGIFSSNSTQVKHQKEQALLDSFRFPGFVKEAAHYYEKNFIKYPEALDTDMVSKMTGFGKSAVTTGSVQGVSKYIVGQNALFQKLSVRVLCNFILCFNLLAVTKA